MNGGAGAADGERAALAEAWRAAAADAGVAEAIRTLYAEVEAEVARRRPICLASGRCCHFDAWGHRLFVTGLEAAWCVAEMTRGADERSALGGRGVADERATAGGPHGVQPRDPQAARRTELPVLPVPPVPPVLPVLPVRAAAAVTAAQVAEARARGDCPFLVGRLCGAHAARPLGCRMFFCDPAAEEWTRELHESSLRRLRALHDERSIPYRYGEWRDMLDHLAV